MKCKAWPVDYEEPESFREWAALDVGEVAEQYVELNFGDLDYPHEIAINVRTLDGVLHVVNVEVEPVPSFRATKCRHG